MSTSALKRLSVEEFLALEAASDVKHEYFDGEAFAMAGGSARHSQIAVNLSAGLHAAALERGCNVYSSDLMVFCPTGLRTYPDVSVVCEQPRFEDDRELTLLNPLVVVEVLSETTEAYDRGRKFENYQSIPSLREVALVAQDRAHVDHFARRDDGRWVLTSHSGLTGSVEFPALACAVPMAAFYAGVALTSPDGAAGAAPPAAE